MSAIGLGLRAAVAGTVATRIMDLVTTAMLDAQAPAVTQREEAARPNGKAAVSNLVDRIEAWLDSPISPETRGALEQAIHYGLGVGPAVAYAVARRRVPLVGAGRGLLYGLLLFAVADEYMTVRLGLAGPFEAYPIETHLRGLVGHVVLGIATDTGLDLLGG